jgi:hypothetical protein
MGARHCCVCVIGSWKYISGGYLLKMLVSSALKTHSSSNLSTVVVFSIYSQTCFAMVNYRLVFQRWEIW